jgi:hypothetical protein
MDARPFKRAAPTADEVLCAGILQDGVLEFVGPGHCLHISPVCKAWQESYNQVAAVTLAVVTRDGRNISFDCTSAMTFLSLAFTSRGS